MVHETRVIPLDERPHAGGSVRGYMGEARGLCEGHTLVVETTNLRDESVERWRTPPAARAPGKRRSVRTGLKTSMSAIPTVAEGER
jgi:hypothetical protein